MVVDILVRLLTHDLVDSRAQSREVRHRRQRFIHSRSRSQRVPSNTEPLERRRSLPVNKRPGEFDNVELKCGVQQESLGLGVPLDCFV